LGIGLQAGGYVYGPLGAGDIIPALLSPGEFVLNRNAVAMIGSSTLHLLNNKARGYQSGGLVMPEGGNHVGVVQANSSGYINVNTTINYTAAQGTTQEQRERDGRGLVSKPQAGFV
jgi:hypothetical protein